MTTSDKTPSEQTEIKPAPVSPFASLQGFKPKPKPKPAPALGADNKEILKDINKVAEDNGFHSRAAQPAEAAAKKNRRRFGTSEPKMQLNIKVTEANIERFYSMAKERNIRALGDLFELALDALEATDKKKK
jgi:hypothetical protein